MQHIHARRIGTLVSVILVLCVLIVAWWYAG
jgi:hypothetical protein